MKPTDSPRTDPLAILFLAWLPLAVLLPAAASQITPDPMEGIRFGARSALVGALLMWAAWSFIGRFASARTPNAVGYLSHLGIAVGFAVVWRLAVLLITGFEDVSGPFDYTRSAFLGPLMLWDLLLKIVVYGLVIGLWYAVREAARAREERLRAARVDALATRAQLAALQSQLNPHFLFNTLHSLTVLIQREPAQAEEAVHTLGDLLRFTLRHSGQDEIAFREELRFVENYVALEQFRFEQRLRVVTDIDPRAVFVRVPPFCLQPLVENAIRHGLSPREDGGTIWITARFEHDALRLEVRDDGVGAKRNGRPDVGSGLSSLRQRIETLGVGGRLTIDPAPVKGFSVAVHIPLANGIDDDDDECEAAAS